MKKTITIYELLELVKDGKAPKKIKFCGNIYEWEGGWYLTKEKYYKVCLGGKKEDCNILINAFNDNVEIIGDEEEFEDIYNFCWNENYLFSNRQTGMTKEDRRLLDSNFKDIHDTINQLIKNQKKIIERINNEKNNR